jgi:hypothetical protein
MNQTEYEDKCSRCGQPCTRVRVQLLKGAWTKVRYVTSCCEAKPVLVRRET